MGALDDLLSKAQKIADRKAMAKLTRQTSKHSSKV